MGVFRSKGPKPEARRAESADGVIGEGQRATSLLARDLGERCKLHSGVRGG